MPPLQAPVHPFDPAVRNGAADQQQLLVAHGGEFLGDALHRAVHFLQAPAEAVVLWAAAGDVALVAPQARQLFQALLQAAIPQLLSVLFRLVLSLLV